MKSNFEISNSSSLPISKLIKHIKYSFLERDFNKVQNIQLERENDLKIEIENLTRDRDSAKEEVRVLERKGDSVELERLNFEENLRQSRRKCEDLEEKVARLLEEIKVSNDREKRADERRDKIFAEHTKMRLEKNKLISELNDKINELKTKNLENERLLGDYKEKCKCLDIKVANMDQEIEGLTREKLNAFKTIKELRAENSEAKKIIDELKLKKSKSDEVDELYNKIVERLSVILTGKDGHIADLAELYEKINKHATSDGRANLEFSGSKGKNDSLGNGSATNAAEIGAVNASSPGVRKSPISTGSKNNGLSKKGDRNSIQRRAREEEDNARTVNTPRVSQPVRDPLQAESNKCKEPLDSGDRNSIQRRTREEEDNARTAYTPRVSQLVRDPLQAESNKRKEPLDSGDRNSIQRRTREEEDTARTVNTPRVSQPVRDPLQAESNKRKEPLDSGARASGMRLMSIARCSTKSTCSFAAAGDIIEIIDSDDETNPAEKTRIPNRVSGSKPSKNKTNLVQSPLPEQRSKRNRIDSGEGLSENSITKKEKNTCPSNVDTAEKAHIPNRVSGSNPSKNKTNLVQSPLPEQRSKRNRIDSGEGLSENSITKKKQNTCPSNVDTVSIKKKENQTPKPTTTRGRIDCSSPRKCAGDEAGLACGTQIPVEKFNNGLKDEHSESSDDESLSDSRMVNLVASLRNKSIGRKIAYEADMLRAIQQDEDLCLSAVCALYRQEVIARKLKGHSVSSKNGGFSPTDSIRGCALAEYLIDGDKELRLRKSVPEVKKQRPDVIGQCRKLANFHIEKLFEIYCSGEDPLFSQS